MKAYKKVMDVLAGMDFLVLCSHRGGLHDSAFYRIFYGLLCKRKEG